MDKKAYDLVLKLTENSHDAISLFYRLSALLAVGQSEEALKLILTRRLILQQKLALLIKFHIEILCLLRRFDEAYRELDYYKELPYESQEVEEILRAMPSYIRKEEKASFGQRHLDEDELKKMLLSDNDEDVLAALDSIKSLPLDGYLLIILKIMRSHPRQIIRTFALLLLVDKKYDKEVDFLYVSNIMKVVPSSLNDPFIIPDIGGLDKVSFALQSEYHDPSIAQNALHILSSYILYIYPKQIDFSLDEILIIFGTLAKKLLLTETNDLESLCFSKGLDYLKVRKSIQEIEEDLKNF